MRETLIVIRSKCEESIPVERKVVSIIRVAESSLRVTLLFSISLTQHSRPRSE